MVIYLRPPWRIRMRRVRRWLGELCALVFMVLALALAGLFNELGD